VLSVAGFFDIVGLVPRGEELFLRVFFPAAHSTVLTFLGILIWDAFVGAGLLTFYQIMRETGL